MCQELQGALQEGQKELTLDHMLCNLECNQDEASSSSGGIEFIESVKSEAKGK